MLPRDGLEAKTLWADIAVKASVRSRRVVFMVYETWLMLYSGNDVRDHFSPVDNLDWPVTGSHQLLVSNDAKLLINSRGKIGRENRVFLRLGGQRVRFAIDDALFQAASCKKAAENLGPVVAAGRFVDFWGAAELRGEHHQC